MLEGLRSCRLERLELGTCGRGFGDVAAAAMAARGPLPVLRSLRLGGAYRLRDGDLALLLERAPNLEQLRLPQCSLLQDAACLPRLCPSIRFATGLRPCHREHLGAPRKHGLVRWLSLAAPQQLQRTPQLRLLLWRLLQGLSCLTRLCTTVSCGRLQAATTLCGHHRVMAWLMQGSPQHLSGAAQVFTFSSKPCWQPILQRWKDIE